MQLDTGRLKTPRAEIAIPACGVGNFRVRRLTFPQAAFWLAKYGLKISDLLNRLSFSVLLGRNACLLTKKATEMRLVLEPHQGGYLLDALTAVAEADLRTISSLISWFAVFPVRRLQTLEKYFGVILNRLAYSLTLR